MQHSNGRTQDGLLIELSLQSCRISKVKGGALSAGQTTKVKIDGYGDLEVQVRWAHDDCVGLRFTPPLRTPDLNHLIQLCRSEEQGEIPLRSYGT